MKDKLEKILEDRINILRHCSWITDEQFFAIRKLMDNSKTSSQILSLLEDNLAEHYSEYEVLRKNSNSYLKRIEELEKKLSLVVSEEEIEKVIREYRHKIDDDAKGIYIGENSGEWEEEQDKELAHAIHTKIMGGEE